MSNGTSNSFGTRSQIAFIFVVQAESCQKPELAMFVATEKKAQSFPTVLGSAGDQCSNMVDVVSPGTHTLLFLKSCTGSQKKSSAIL